MKNAKCLLYAVRYFEDYTPFSNEYHNNFFKKLKPQLKSCLDAEGTVEADIDCFEEQLKNNNELQEAYLDVYSKDASFHICSLEIEEIDYEFFVMSKKGEIVLIFFKNGAAVF